MSVYDFCEKYGYQFVDGFEMNNGAYVGDPCYTLSLNGGLIFENIRPGRWDFLTKIVNTGFAGVRVMEICAIHQEGTYRLPNEMLYDTVGVDSGMMSIFDLDYYKEHDGEIAMEEGNICDGIYKGGISFSNKGCLSCSGYGDGEYVVYVNEPNGIIDGIRIKFFSLDANVYNATKYCSDVIVEISENKDDVKIYNMNNFSNSYNLLGYNDFQIEEAAAKMTSAILRATEYGNLDNYKKAFVMLWCQTLLEYPQQEPSQDTINSLVMQLNDEDINILINKIITNDTHIG